METQPETGQNPTERDVAGKVTEPRSKIAALHASLKHIEPYLAAGLLIITGLQCRIMNQQTRISDDQKLIAERQLHLSTRPNVVTKIQVNEKDGGAEKLVIRNDGIFSVRNVQISYLYFAKIVDKGWIVSVPVMREHRDKLAPTNEWAYEIAGYAKALKNPPTIMPIEGNLQYCVFLISFEREIDGHAYVALEPMFLINGQLITFNGNRGNPAEGGPSGPLAHTCNTGAELTFEYFRRNPFPRNFELYNYEYLLGYQATGCLGPITWEK